MNERHFQRRLVGWLLSRKETQIVILESRLPFFCIEGGHVTNLASVVIKREGGEVESRDI